MPNCTNGSLKPGILLTVPDAAAAFTARGTETTETSRGVVQLTDSTSSTSRSTAATPNSVKAACDLANAAQATADEALALTSGSNMLINADFRNPVNQRGKMVYTSNTESGIYTIDRWKGRNGAYTLTVLPDAIKIESTSGYGVYFEQLLEKSIKAACVASVLVKSVTGTCIIQPIYADGTSGTSVILTEGLNTVTYDPNKELAKIFMQINAGATIELVAVKLELGDTQTIAHHEDGAWVLNEIPDFGEELLKCQRYYQLFTSADKRHSDKRDFRPVMRIDPAIGTIEIDGVTYYYADAEM